MGAEISHRRHGAKEAKQKHRNTMKDSERERDKWLPVTVTATCRVKATLPATPQSV